MGASAVGGRRAPPGPQWVTTPLWTSARPEKSAAREGTQGLAWQKDRKSTRLNSSHATISYAVFCLKKNLSSPPMLLNDPAHLFKISSITTVKQMLSHSDFTLALLTDTHIYIKFIRLSALFPYLHLP